MEKIGVEVVKPEQDNLTKLAANINSRPSCLHPKDRVYTSQGVSFCRKCEKYIKIDGQ